MHPDLSKKALDKIETLCGHGCTEVNQILERAIDGSHIEELSEFNQTEIKLILHELKQIMAVYNKQG